MARSGTMLIRISALAALLCLAGCGGGDGSDDAGSAGAGATPPAARQVAQAMLQSMGGQAALEAVQTLTARGSGIRHHLGQIPETGGEDPRAGLTSLMQVIDIEGNRAGWDYQVQIEGGFAQQRNEAFTRYQGSPVGRGTTGGRPEIVTSPNGLFSWATHNTPTVLLRRNPVTVALTAREAGPEPVRETDYNGESYWALDTTLDGEALTLLVYKESGQLLGFTALDTETMRGDQQATYIYSDYRPVGELRLPHTEQIRHGEGLFARIEWEAISVNDDAELGIFDIPAEATAQADQVVAMAGESWAPLEWVEVAAGVWHIVAFSHHSMVVEFPSFVAVVEGAYTEAQSLTLARQIEENLGKPIRYVIPTHPHHDHTGGLRGLASTGAAVLTAAGHEAEIRGIIESPHSNPADALARNASGGGEVGHVEVFSGMTEISEGERTLALYELDTVPHVKPFTLAAVPDAGVIFQSDLFFGGPGPDAEALYEAVQAHNPGVEQIVGGHGGVLPFTALEEAVSGSN